MVPMTGSSRETGQPRHLHRMQQAHGIRLLVAPGRTADQA